MAVEIESFVRMIPKAELHLHLEGAIAAPTVVELARKHGVTLPIVREVSELYDFPNLGAFLKVYDLISQSVRDAADFHRITYEALGRSASCGARYVEFFFSPQAHLEFGVAYSTMLEGILAGMRDAERDHRILSRLIPAHNRELGPAKGEEFLDMVLADRPDEVIGIGLDYNELPYPPDPYAAMYARARAAGLRVTAHAGENGPAENVRTAIGSLGCRRIDHGYHVVDDPALMALCREDGIFFTCCPTTTLFTTPWRDLTASDHAIRRMGEFGLAITINTDDPGMFRTDLAAEYLHVAGMGFGRDELGEFALNGLRAAWLDDVTKSAVLADWSAQIALAAGP
ncbi:MAG: Adenine deaminase [Rhodospirillales bacterium]|nr:Adenine deaminase [Rhodospirillales bacterium]